MMPRCPNHQIPLVEFQREPGTNHGRGICPISGVRFEAQGDFQDKVQQKKLDKYGNPMISWTLKQIDGGTGG